MHGWINHVLEAMVLEMFGESVWEQTKKDAGCSVPTGRWVLLEVHDDSVTVSLAVALCAIVKLEIPVALEAFGKYFMQHVRAKGYYKLLACQGSNLKTWLSNINELHEHLKNTMSKQFDFPEV